MSTRLISFASALLGALTVAVVVVALALAGVFDRTAAPAPATDSTPAAESGSGERAESESPATTGVASPVADIYERARPGLVDVQVPAPAAAAQGTPFGPPRGGREEGTASGSGFVVDERGFILTNEHVVEQARNVRVRFEGEDDPVPARVVGTDPSTDLAVLKVDPNAVDDLTPLPLGSSEDLRVGEPTIALGSPFGLEGTLTTGVVSALERPIPATNGFTIEDAVQTDAAINPGNSGGPLLDGRGRVIGINAQIRTSAGTNSGVGFAIPIDTAKEILPQLERGGKVQRPYLGVSTGDVPSGDGVLVARVQPNDPADDAGLREGDVLVRVGGRATNAPEDVAAAIADKRIGEEIEVTYRRGGQERTAQVTLAERPRQVRG